MNAGVVHLLSPIVAGAIAVAVTLLLLRSGNLPLDRPNSRSLHSVPVPRTGGLAIMAGVFAAALLLCADPGIVGPVAALAILSYLDDRFQLPAPVRLAAHLIAAGAFVWISGLSGNPLIALALVLALGWLTNLYNFMDGSDGLAGGMAVIGFGTYGLAAWLGGNLELELLAWSVAAAAAGFLIFNFPPARIFMGDVGSIPLGFLAGALGVAGWLQGIWPLWFPPIVFAPFVADASITLLRRALGRERLWQAHRQHYYQRLILSGWSHRKTAIWEYALMLACAALALAGREAVAPVQAAAVVVAIAACAGCAVWIDRRRAQHRE